MFCCAALSSCEIEFQKVLAADGGTNYDARQEHENEFRMMKN
jgi:hypothetical protein